MIQPRQPKKVKGARKKSREELLNRLQSKYPTWFEGKTGLEIKRVIAAFKASGKKDEEFPMFCIEFEAKMETLMELGKCKKTNDIRKAAKIMNRIVEEE
jgi:hypothetical protein